LRDVFL
jgi:hypothetical protein